MTDQEAERPTSSDTLSTAFSADRLRWTVFLVTVTASFLGSALMTAQLSMLDNPPISRIATGLVLLVAYGAAALTAWLTRHHRLAYHIYCMTFLSGVVVSSLETGGILSPLAFILMGMPVAVCFFLGRLATLAYVTAALAAAISLYVLAPDIPHIDGLAPKLAELSLTTIVVVMLTTTGVVLGYDLITRRAIAGMHSIALAEARANASKSVFLANMSHEIRTPMNGIIGMLELASREDELSRVRDHCRVAAGSARHLMSILNDVLDYSKLDGGKVRLAPEPVHILRELDHVLSLMQPRAQEKNLHLSLTTEGPLDDWLLGDATRLRQVLINLTGNAIKFTTSGRVDVLASGDAAGADAVRLHIRVQDTGPGIPPEAQGKIFERFEQVDGSATRAHGGTGLGLAISKQLIDCMDGEIGVESRPGDGACFWFTVTLPRTEAPETPAADATEGEGAPLTGLHVLVAEDHPVNQLLVRHVLERLGATQETVPNGAAALERLERERFDLVLMDGQMPVMDGEHATRAIRSLEGPIADIPIIGLTANVMPGDRERYLEAGMSGYVGKPLDVSDLVAEIERVRGLPGKTANAPVSQRSETVAGDQEDDGAAELRALIASI